MRDAFPVPHRRNKIAMRDVDVPRRYTNQQLASVGGILQSWCTVGPSSVASKGSSSLKLARRGSAESGGVRRQMSAEVGISLVRNEAI